MNRLVGWVLLLGLTACASGAAPKVPAAGPFKSFEFLGCAGDWPMEDRPIPTIRRLTADEQVTFLVRHPGSCGLMGRNPVHALADGQLRLNYELYSRDESIVMCECEYWAKFTFDESMLKVNIEDVTFGGE